MSGQTTRGLIATGLFLALGLLGACSGKGLAPDGHEGGRCFENGTCNDGLSCVSTLCVDLSSVADVPSSTDLPAGGDSPIQADFPDVPDPAPVDVPDAAPADAPDAPPADAPDAPQADVPDAPPAEVPDLVPVEDLDLGVEPSSIDFGPVAIQATSTISVRLSHIGTSGTIRFADVRIESASGEFTLEPPAVMSLAPGESTVVRVTYAPVDPTDDGGFLVIRHNVPGVTETRIPITASGQTGDLVAVPSPIDFGDVPAGEARDLDVVLRNAGTAVVSVTQLHLQQDGSADFTLQSLVLPGGGSLPVDLKAGEEMGVVLRYRPQGGGADASRLTVEGETRGAAQKWAFAVLGRELGPRLVAAPGEIDFRWVPLNETREALLLISNEGSADLVIEALSVAPESDVNIAIPDAPTGPVAIAPGGEATYHVTWTPKEANPDGSGMIGVIAILSNDPGSPSLIPVFGRVDSPFLEVIPSSLDLGFAPPAQAITRMLTLRNGGHGPLVISALRIQDVSDTTYGDEFAYAVDPEYATGPNGEWVVEGGQILPVSVSFTNKGPGSGVVTARLAITSNSPGNESLTVGLSVARVREATCKVVLVPDTLNFGTVAEGFSRELPLNLVNTGTGACSFRSARIEDCVVFMGMTPQCQAPGASTNSGNFQLVALPPAVLDGIGPGASVPLRIRFAPRNVASAFGELTDYSALLSVVVWDAANEKEIVIPAGTGGGVGGAVNYEPNLKGTGGIAKVSVLPDLVDFGAVTIGCFSRRQKVCVFNAGNVPIQVTDLSFQGCTPEFRTRNVPPLPQNASPGVPFCFELAYAPQDLGSDECTLQVVSEDASVTALTVALRGAGTYDTHQIDTFLQVSGQDVDVLFILDDSGSMCDKQQRLIENFDSFLQSSMLWDNNFHIGVMSLNVVDEGVVGRLNRGNKRATPRFVTPGPDATAQLKTLANLGCEGNSDAQEAALQAGQIALSPPLTTESGVVCSTDDECRNDKDLCSDARTCPYYCIDGTCGGWNKGFLRPEAQLEVIILSDEEDQSPSTPAFYIDFFRSLKGYYNTGMMHVNTIVGIEDGSGQGGICTGADGSAAQAGLRYLEVAEATGGKAGSICDSTFASVVNEIGGSAFGLRVQFHLSRLADPATVNVKVKGQACGSGWAYEATSNSVIFDEKAACMPQPGDEIVIDYETLCPAS